jgi:ethanolaminephosphotransferase
MAFFIHRFQFFPRNIAPNIMTFAGFLLTALNFLLLSYYDWDFYASTDDDQYPDIPSWCWIFASINIFVAYTLGETLI